MAVEGVHETARELEEFAGAVADMPTVVARIAVKGVEVMRPLIPFRTGALRMSARGEVVNGAAVLTAGGPTIRYAAAANARSNFVGRTVAALEPPALLELEDGIQREIQTRGLNQ